MIASRGVAVAALFAFAAPAVAQVAPQKTPAPVAAAPAPEAAGAVDALILRTGATVPLKMSEGLTTKGKKLRVGYRFRLETAEPVMVNGVVAIPAGSPAMGEVTDVRNKGMWGKSGAINARLLYVTVNGRQIRLSGQMDDKGVTGTAGVVAAVAFVPIAGFFTTGTSAQIPLGAAVTGFTDEDVPLAVNPAAMPAPMPVSAPATPMAAAPAPAAQVIPAVATAQ